jgi:hypothetical protein
MQEIKAEYEDIQDLQDLYASDLQKERIVKNAINYEKVYRCKNPYCKVVFNGVGHEEKKYCSEWCREQDIHFIKRKVRLCECGNPVIIYLKTNGNVAYYSKKCVYCTKKRLDNKQINAL